MQKASIFEEAEGLFGKNCYKAKESRRNPKFYGGVPYRDSGCIYSVDKDEFHTDQEIIVGLLENLDSVELNEIDEAVRGLAFLWFSSILPCLNQN